MNTQRLGCLSPLALTSAFITLVILIAAEIISGNSMFNPGELNARTGTSLGGVTSHAEIGKACGQCHPPFWTTQTIADLCLDCHTEIQGQMGDSSSLHGVLFQGNSPACQTCHTEHHGPEASLTVWDRVGFAHELTGFSLTGHQTRSDGLTFACNDCHTQGFSSFDQQACTDCHRLLDQAFTDTHIHDFGEVCLSCHDGVDRYGDFDHSQLSFALTGAHQQVSCSGCHLNDRTVSDLKDTPTECEACHLSDDAHDGKFGAQCGVCHTSEGWSPAKFDHSLAEFTLEGKHIEVPCENCHTDGFKGTPKDCYSCHQQDDEHDGAFGTACETCHNPSDWKDATFDHSLAAFPLDGAHVNVACTECHINNVFKGTPHECAACHAEPDYHLGMFTGQACSDCHTTTAWSPARYDGPHTFPMNHGGTNNLCKDCHQPTLAQWTCYTCHDRAEVESKHIEEGISNFSDCLRCHPTGLQQESGGGGGDD
jgi:hypothetical protein